MKRKTLIYILPVTAVVLAVAGYMYYQDGRVQTASDCTSVEQFDPETKSCFYDCETNEECDELARKVDSELNSYFEDSKSKLSENNDEKPTPQEGERVYQNSNGTLSPSPIEADLSAWELFGRISGDKVKQNVINSVTMYDNEQDDTAASVARTESGGKWDLSINLAFRNDSKDFIHTLVHEYGHIVSLSSDQVSAVSGSCPALELAEGCVNQNSYIQAFNDKFWSKFGGDVPENEGENADEVTDFFNQNGGEQTFVSDYAATNLTEDFAETFAIFVLRSKPTGNTEADQKVISFYDNPELVSIRERIRSATAKELSERNLLKRD